MFAYTSFIGFEAAALFGEESQNPTQSIPRATLISVAAIGVFYLATAWLVIGAAGPEEARATATEKGGEFLFVLIGRFAGETAAELGGLLLCTSLLAAYLAIHNAATRYLFALGREKILPPFLGQFNARRYAPSAASATITLATLVSIGLFFVSGKDPYLTIMPTLVGLATLGVIALQALAAIAIVAYFRRQRAPKLWSATLAPSIGAVGLAAAVVLVVRQFPVLTGVDDAVLNYSPTIYPALAVAGVGFAAWLRHYRPVIYEGIGRIDLRAQPSRRTLPLARYSLRHCGPRTQTRRHTVRPLRAPLGRRRHLGHRQPRHAHVRVGTLHLIKIHLGIFRVPDAGRLSRLPKLPADPGLYPQLRQRLRPDRIDPL